MAYKIAFGSSDGVNVDVHFGNANEFIIYEVEGESYKILEKRLYSEDEVGSSCESSCGSRNGCKNGSGGGCGGGENGKVDLLSDCRCIVCAKIGLQIQKILERKAISAFDVICTIEEALSKIVPYYAKLDGRKINKGLL